MKKAILYIFCMIISFQILGQDTTEIKNDNLKNSVSVEILGATGYFSVNYERTFNVVKNFNITPGLGIGYADDLFSTTTPQLLSYIIKLDIPYKMNKVFQPVIGYAFSHNFEVGSPSSFREECKNRSSIENCETKYTYKINSLSIGLGITIYKKFEITPRYYALFEKRSDHPEIIFINWSGLQLRYKF